MRPNFQHDQVVWFNKVPPSELQRGGVIVFRPSPSPDRRFLKRIVGLPGEHVKITRGIIYVNGQELLEPYEVRPSFLSMEPIVLQVGEYFVLGDDRPRSSDSRNWGPVPANNILGRVAAGGDD